MLDPPQLKARVARLDELVRALLKEIVVIRDAEDSLLYLERKAYLEAMGRALASLDAARVTLAGAAQRMEWAGQADTR